MACLPAHVLPAGTSVRSIGVQVPPRGQVTEIPKDGDEFMEANDEERDLEIAALKKELLKLNSRVAELLEQTNSLQAYILQADAAKADLEKALHLTDMRLADSLRANGDLAIEKARLASDLRIARLDKRDLVQKDAEILELLGKVEEVEKENMDLTFQSLDAIWR